MYSFLCVNAKSWLEIRHHIHSGTSRLLFWGFQDFCLRVYNLCKLKLYMPSLCDTQEWVLLIHFLAFYCWGYVLVSIAQEKKIHIHKICMCTYVFISLHALYVLRSKLSHSVGYFWKRCSVFTFSHSVWPPYSEFHASEVQVPQRHPVYANLIVWNKKILSLTLESYTCFENVCVSPILSDISVLCHGGWDSGAPYLSCFNIISVFPHQRQRTSYPLYLVTRNLKII